jgi:hypothetical protein
MPGDGVVDDTAGSVRAQLSFPCDMDDQSAKSHHRNFELPGKAPQETLVRDEEVAAIVREVMSKLRQ